MSASVICRACGARLKLPPEFTKKKAKCPKCNARMDVAAALDATAYLPKLAKEAIQTTGSQSTLTPTTEREEDPLPYPSLNPATSSPVTPAKPTKLNDSKKNGSVSPHAQKQLEPLPLDDPPLSLDDTSPHAESPSPPTGPAPFRVPIQVIADSANLFNGPCDAVFVSHGMFLESIPYRPFLYVPLRSTVGFEDRGGLEVKLPDGRRITVSFSGHNAQRLVQDTAAFLAGERGAPSPGEYRGNPLWMFGLVFVLALVPAIGPIVLSRTANFGTETGLKLGVAFAFAGLLANLAIVLRTRMSVLGKIAAMTSIGVVVTGELLFGTAAYLAGRKDAGEPATPELPTPLPPPKPSDQKPDSPPDPPVKHPTTAMDVAYRDGVYRFEDGPDEVTALAVGADSSVLVIGYKNGITRMWRFDRSTIDPSDFDLGPKSDGQPTSIQFDGTGSIIYMTCAGGMVAALWNNPPEMPVKIPGDSFAVYPAPGRERFAALRGNALSIRYVPTSMILKPTPATKKASTPPKAKGFLVTTNTDEILPADVKGPLASPPGRPTFLAWHPTGKLLGGIQDGSILSWGATGPGSTVATREHKAPVRAWAASPSTWDFATGDDKGVIGVWFDKSLSPKTFNASVSAAIAQLSFSPSGSHLAARDSEGVITVWDLSAQRANLKVRRPAAKTIAFGPTDDLLLLSDGKAVELWYIPELDRRP
jgi:hypothetical protein